MSWHARLSLDYRRDGDGTTAHDAHEGPLRVLQRLYPEGPAVCHHVVVHPPGGVVGGDVLAVDARLAPGAHALVTTPGATRFYRSGGRPARQSATLVLAAGARIEWLPLETIAYRGCEAENRLTLELAPGAEAIGWDLLALGLPAAGEGFDAGRFTQHLEWPGVWIERGTIDAADAVLLDGAVGLGGRRALGTLWFAAGTALDAARREALLDAVRGIAPPEGVDAGATSPDARLLVLRALAHRIEPLMAFFVQARAAWRQAGWALAAHPPRVWRT